MAELPAAESPATDSPTSGLRHNKNWQLLWLGQSISITGNYIFDTTVVLWIATIIARGKPWGPAAVGGVLIAAAVPALIVGPVAGVFVDRWNRRRIMMTSDVCSAALIASLLVLPAFGSHLSAAIKLGMIYAVVALAASFTQFFAPSRAAIIQSVVAADDRVRAMGLLQSMASFAAIVGPPLAAPLLFVFGVQWALVIDAASFLVSFAAIWTMRLPSAEHLAPSARPGFRREFAAGLRFFRSSPVLVALAIGVVVATFGAGAINVLMVYFLKVNLHSAPRWLGTLDAAEGAGAIVGALLAGWIAAKVGSGRAFWGGLVVCGVVLIVLSRATSLPVALAIMACIGLALGPVNVLVGALLLGATPQEMLGRVTSVISPMQQLASVLSMAGVGFLASTALRGFNTRVGGMSFGPYDVIFAGCGLVFVAAGLAVIRPLRARSDSASPEPTTEVAGQPVT
ncbi:MAG TPA: MFS transporter [Streptosporangiaceae bacterium]|nr:MFS transporter [Streptosporangiaceae bacterium]